MGTSTPAAPEMRVRRPSTVPEMLAPVTGQASAYGNGPLDLTAGPVMSPGSMYGDEERLERLRDPLVNDRRRNSPLQEDRELQARRESLRRSSEEPRTVREIGSPREEAGVHRGRRSYEEESNFSAVRSKKKRGKRLGEPYRHRRKQADSALCHRRSCQRPSYHRTTTKVQGSRRF